MSLMTLVASDNLLKGEDTATNLHLLDRSLSIAMDLIWRQFVEPIWKVLNEKMLIPHDSPITFVTQGILDYLPLHAAARKVKGQWRFAIEDRVIRYAPTLQALNTMKAQASTHRCEPRIAGFFDPLGDLPSSRGIELRELASIGTPSNIAYWVGDKASRNQFLKTLENWDELIYSDLHVSTHSEFCLDRPESSYLVFSSEEHEESHITAAEIFGLPPLSSLNHVCLASCVSGRSDIGKSSGEPRNLVAAFLHIGASSVLSSLYPLIDRPAANLISSIYKRRASGDELAEAIRNEICERLIIARQKGHSVICLDENAPSSETSGPYINEQINGWYENQGVLPLSWWAGLKPTCPG
jgi:CHAT domain-containing protein